jgi:hypothetical protein
MKAATMKEYLFNLNHHTFRLPPSAFILACDMLRAASRAGDVFG